MCAFEFPRGGAPGWRSHPVARRNAAERGRGPGHPTFSSIFVWGVLLLGVRFASASVPLEIPQIADARLQIALYADAPDIVTPIGAAVDARGRLFVLESHTHLAPSKYQGPKRDRVIVFEGARSDGRANRRSVFADQILEGLNVAFAPDGTLYVVTAKTVVALPDRDDDGRADEANIVLRLETEQLYPHNQLLGITFSPDGWLYASRGNTGGDPHAWVAADGRRLEAYGNGGDIVRCRPDGSQLERVATGFWNPFDLKFDRHGRLLCVDNDPDSRGPNRLLHIVAGGDYGFKALYGASGLHPYNAWDGDLPGTLPMIAGIGESPSGVLDLSFGALPSEYRDAIAATIWGEHQVSIVRTKAAGASLRGSAEPFIRGGKWFRPVAITAAPDGAIYITDWVLKDYPNHGHGRIWKLTTREGAATMKPARTARVERLPAVDRQNLADLLTKLKDTDPFVRHAAIVALARPEWRSAIVRELEGADPALRLGALLALRRTDVSDIEALIRGRLRDTDENVRLMALIWAGEKELKTLKTEIEATVTLPNFTSRWFETWLATLQILNAPASPLPGAKRVAGFRIKRDVDLNRLGKIAADDSWPAPVRALALRRLAGRPDALGRDLLSALAQHGDLILRIEAIRMLGESGDAHATETLRAIASSRDEPARVRAEAIVALGARDSAALTTLLNDPEAIVRTQAARTLRRTNQENARPPAPDAAVEWVNLLASGGDPEAGERVFFATTSTCVQCHRINGRGGSIGPDLSVIGRTARRDQLIRSIVSPSEEIAPQFQGWEVTSKSGEVFTGLQGHWRNGGAASLILLDGREKVIASGHVASFRAIERSLMPEGLAVLFSTDELRDLIAYLASLR